MADKDGVLLERVVQYLYGAGRGFKLLTTTCPHPVYAESDGRASKKEKIYLLAHAGHMWLGLPDGAWDRRQSHDVLTEAEASLVGPEDCQCVLCHGACRCRDCRDSEFTQCLLEITGKELLLDLASIAAKA